MQESTNFCANDLLKLSKDLDRISHSVETSLCAESSTYFILSECYPRNRLWLR